MSKWQPIETAPKDGTKILAFDPSLFGICLAIWYQGGWYVSEESQDGSGYEDMPISHWMPLPPPPEKETE